MTVLAPLRATSTPVATRASDHRICIRCGIDWRDSRGTFIDRAPCAECRRVLEKEGEDIVELYVREQYKAERRASRDRRLENNKRTAERHRKNQAA